MKKILCACILLFSIVLQAQYTLIPDFYFEQYLVIADIDTDGEVNGQVLTSDIADETQLILTANHSITDLTGIEDFESLEILEIYQMDITTLDISQNINLWRLDISDVSLESIDLTANSNLFAFYLSLNNDAGMFTSPINSIDLSNSVLLNTLRISNTFITEIDLTNNLGINKLFILNMDDLITVNIKNGANWDISLLEIRDNLNLQCLQVDDPDAVIEGVIPPYDVWIIENNPLLIITDDCNLGVEDISLRNQIILYPNPVKDLLYIDINSSYIINVIKVYDVLGRLVLQKSNPTGQIDVSNLASGLLLVELELEQGVLTKKIVKNTEK